MYIMYIHILSIKSLQSIQHIIAAHNMTSIIYDISMIYL